MLQGLGCNHLMALKALSLARRAECPLERLLDSIYSFIRWPSLFEIKNTYRKHLIASVFYKIHIKR